MTNNIEYIRQARAKYDAYDRNVWKRDYFDEDTGGYVITHKGHRFDIINGVYELETAITLAKNGYFVEMMNEPLRILQYDMKVNGFPSEIKVMSGFRNIHRRAVEADEQGARRVVYCIRFDNDIEMFKRFNNVYKTIENIEEIWYVKNGKLFYFKKKCHN